MVVTYTITITEDLITIKFTDNEINLDSESELNIPSITNTRTNTNVEILSMNQIEQTLVFKVEMDAEYKMYVQETTPPNEIYLEYFLININALAAGNLLNKKDVNKIIKQASVYNSSKLIDCLNRVVIAYHRTSEIEEDYLKVNEILALIESIADNNCEEC